MAAERPRGENQPSPMALAVEASGNFAKEELEKSHQLKKAAESIFKKLTGGQTLEADKKKEVLESAQKMVMSGAGAAMGRIGLLPAFANPDPEARKQIVEKIKKDNPDAEGLDVYEGWNVNSDPNGLGVLNHFKRESLAKFDEQAKGAKDESEKAQIAIQAEAFGKGWDLMQGEYKKQLQSASGGGEKKLPLAA